MGDVKIITHLKNTLPIKAISENLRVKGTVYL